MAAYSVSKNSVDLVIDPLITCKLCLGEYPLEDMYELWDCKCLYCETCMQQYVAVMITEGNVAEITCPDALCKKQGRLGTQEVEKLIDRRLFVRYQRLNFLRGKCASCIVQSTSDLKEKNVDMDPNRTFCPEAGCETVCNICNDPTVEVAHPVAVQCPTCGLQFCSVCKSKWHASKPCDDAAKPEESGIPFDNEVDVKTKRCPMCHVPIERNDGCAQMMCKRCKHMFCWYCLQSLDDDFLLRHYDKGPCKNKFGHSRATVIWYRAQVVTVVAVLLLVASPFLLLAAPCISCCMCKMCKCCDNGLAT